jgi:membrane protease YdiL (CAAX protease family)
VDHGFVRYGLGGLHEGGEIMNPMNPLKWSVWVRIAVVVTIVWMVGGFAAWYGKSDRLSPDDILGFLFPVVLFWGIAWILLGISDRKVRVRVIKILIGIPIVIVAAGALVFIFVQILDSLFPSPASLVPQRSEAPLEIAPPASFPYQALPKPGGDRRR